MKTKLRGLERLGRRRKKEKQNHTYKIMAVGLGVGEPTVQTWRGRDLSQKIPKAEASGEVPEDLWNLQLDTS